MFGATTVVLYPPRLESFIVMPSIRHDSANNKISSNTDINAIYDDSKEMATATTNFTTNTPVHSGLETVYDTFLHNNVSFCIFITRKK
jgi:hypothetical protein